MPDQKHPPEHHKQHGPPPPHHLPPEIMQMMMELTEKVGKLEGKMEILLREKK